MSKISTSRKIESAAMSHYRQQIRDGKAPEWNDRKYPKRTVANGFFLGVMLDMTQPADRAWDAGKHLANNHFNQTGNFWNNVTNTNLDTIRKICRTGYDGKAYAAGWHVNKFPKRLKENAKMIISKYESDVRNIWNHVRPEDVHVIYDRFLEFSGIGDALARMAQFILVREYGIAGGAKNKRLMKVKPDVHVCRVSFRLGVSESKAVGAVDKAIDRLKLKSPADFDWVLFDVGKKYCKPSRPKCPDCPLNKVCQWHLASSR